MRLPTATTRATLLWLWSYLAGATTAVAFYLEGVRRPSCSQMQRAPPAAHLLEAGLGCIEDLMADGGAAELGDEVIRGHHASGVPVEGVQRLLRSVHAARSCLEPLVHSLALLHEGMKGLKGTHMPWNASLSTHCQVISVGCEPWEALQANKA